jgi:hypothetical protein
MNNLIDRDLIETANETFGSTLPEAPLSIHIDAYYKGFHAGITIRR